MSTARISIRLAWWVRPYLHSVAVFSVLTGMEPDYAKVSAVVKRGLLLVSSR